jgi:SnoaL-like protein
MNRAQIESSLHELNDMVLSGNLLEAFDKYYHDDVSMQENDLPATVSKEANRHREIEFLNNVIEFREAKVSGIGIGDNISFVIWKYDYTHKEWGVRNYSQVSIQEWKDAKIIKERFVYAN